MFRISLSADRHRIVTSSAKYSYRYQWMKGECMSDGSPGETRLSETPEITTQLAASDWNRAELEAMPVPAQPPRRERLFSRKVMFGWALLAIAAYFGVQVAKSAVKASFRQAVEAGTIKSTETKDGLIIETRNGTRVTIRGGRDGDPSVIVDRQTPGGTRTTTTRRTTVTTPTRPTTETSPTTDPQAPPPLPPEAKKR